MQVTFSGSRTNLMLVSVVISDLFYLKQDLYTPKMINVVLTKIIISLY